MTTESQNLSIMMTDIQGYTGTSSASSREQIVDLIRRHNRLMVPVFSHYKGSVVKTIGDAFLVTFKSATDAVVCAIVIQLMLREYNRRQHDEAKRMNLRVVINTGDVSIEEKDIYGDAVNITARMEGLECFPGGSIGISESTYLLMNRNEICAEKIDSYEMKGIPYPVTVFSVPLDRQRLSEIPGRLLDLVEATLAGTAAHSLDPAGMVDSLLPNFPGTETIPAVQAGGDAAALPAPVPPTAGAKEATPWARFFSFVIDLVMAFVLLALLRNTGFSKKPPLVFVLYLTLSWRFFGATVGQKVYELKVATPKGERPGLILCLLRAAATFVTIVSVIGNFIIFFGRRRALQDIVSSTVVVRDEGPTA